MFCNTKPTPVCPPLQPLIATSHRWAPNTPNPGPCALGLWHSLALSLALSLSGTPSLALPDSSSSHQQLSTLAQGSKLAPALPPHQA